MRFAKLTFIRPTEIEDWHGRNIEAFTQAKCMPFILNYEIIRQSE